MHHGQNRGKRKRNLAKIRKLCGNSKGKRMNFAEMGKICKLSDLYEEQEIGEIWNIHNWLRVGMDASGWPHYQLLTLLTVKGSRRLLIITFSGSDHLIRSALGDDTVAYWLIIFRPRL